jgi:DNA invertase Pin-like site-specific DNA recombinase
MAGKKIGYIRVSTIAQNHERQLSDLKLDKIYIDKVSGKSIDRPELQNLLDYARDDDIVYIHSMDRLARNLDDLRNIVTQLTSNNVTVEFVKEGLTFTNKDNPMSVLLLSVMGAFAEFERSLIRERQLEGIAIAKSKGVYKGRKPSLSDEQIALLKEKIKNGEKKTTVAKKFGISRETLYQYIRKLN